jgi:hypothetical protein
MLTRLDLSGAPTQRVAKVDPQRNLKAQQKALITGLFEQRLGGGKKIFELGRHRLACRQLLSTNHLSPKVFRSLGGVSMRHFRPVRLRRQHRLDDAEQHKIDDATERRPRRYDANQCARTWPWRRMRRYGELHHANCLWTAPARCADMIFVHDRYRMFRRTPFVYMCCSLVPEHFTGACVETVRVDSERP